MKTGQGIVHKICVYVPETHVDAVKQAMFDAGAGRIGNYDQCCWQTAGVGQFRPLPGSDAFVGEVGRVELVAEIKVDMVCASPCLERVLAALHAAHPYQSPAYQYWPVNNPVRP